MLDLARIDPLLIDAYARHLRDDPARRPVIVEQLLEVVIDLYLYCKHLPGGGLSFEPWDGRPPARVAGYRHVPENRIPRIPEPIIAPLLAWSLRYITVFAGDILAARRELSRLEARRDRLFVAEEGVPHAERRRRQRQRLASYCRSRARQGRGVPVWASPPNGSASVDPVSGGFCPLSTCSFCIYTSASMPPGSRRCISLSPAAGPISSLPPSRISGSNPATWIRRSRSAMAAPL